MRLDLHRGETVDASDLDATLWPRLAAIAEQVQNALLSYTPLVHSSPTLLSYTPLPHSSRTLLSYTPLVHSSPTLLSHTPLVHSSPPLISPTTTVVEQLWSPQSITNTSTALNSAYPVSARVSGGGRGAPIMLTPKGSHYSRRFRTHLCFACFVCKEAE
jgi:hypothetical protein